MRRTYAAWREPATASPRAAAQQIAPRRCHEIALAVSEAVTNAIVHGYAGGNGDAIVELRAWMHERSLIVVVRDHGVGIGHAPPSIGLGLGLQFIARLTDQLKIDSTAVMAGTRLRMTFAAK